MPKLMIDDCPICKVLQSQKQPTMRECSKEEFFEHLENKMAKDNEGLFISNRIVRHMLFGNEKERK